MAIAGRACVHTILIVGLALICCEAKGVPRAARRGANGDPFKGKTFGRSNIVGRNEKVFNVLQFGAKPDGRKDCTEVNCADVFDLLVFMPYNLKPILLYSYG